MIMGRSISQAEIKKKKIVPGRNLIHACNESFKFVYLFSLCCENVLIKDYGLNIILFIQYL